MPTWGPCCSPQERRKRDGTYISHFLFAQHDLEVVQITFTPIPLVELKNMELQGSLGNVVSKRAMTASWNSKDFIMKRREGSVDNEGQILGMFEETHVTLAWIWRTSRQWSFLQCLVSQKTQSIIKAEGVECRKKNPSRDVHFKWEQPISIIARVSIV